MQMSLILLRHKLHELPPLDIKTKSTRFVALCGKIHPVVCLDTVSQCYFLYICPPFLQLVWLLAIVHQHIKAGYKEISGTQNIGLTNVQ